MASVDGGVGAARRRFEDAAREVLGKEAAREAAADIDRTLAEPLRIALVGSFNTGKSTLLNAWVGRPLLPMDVLPTSAAIVELSCSAPEGLWQVDPGNGGAAASPIDEATFRRLATTAAADEPVLLRAVLPGEAIRRDVVLADTPGIDSLTDAHAAVTYGYLPRCDAVVLLINGSRGGVTASELEFVERHLLESTRRRLLVAVTHVDDVPPERRAALLAEVRGALARHAGLDVSVAGVDARSALDDRAAGGTGAAAGLKALQEAVESRFLAASRQIRADRALRHLQGQARQVAEAARQMAEDLGRDQAALEDRKRALASEREKLAGARDQLRSRMCDARARLLADLAIEADRRVSDLASQAPRYVTAIEAAHGTKADPGARVSQLIRADLARAVEDLARKWLEPRLREFAATVGSELARLTPPDAPIVLRPMAVPGEAALDLLVEGAVLVLLNFVLPGEWLVALVGRILGQKLLDNLLQPIKDALADVVRRLLGGVIRTRLEAEVRSRIAGIREDLLADLTRQVERVMDAIEDQAVRSADAQIAQAERSADEAAEAQRAGADHVRAERRRLERAAGELDGLANGHDGAPHAK